ncbi:MAG: DUF362 domain-containing protein [Bryobacteraceae bacterium]
MSSPYSRRNLFQLASAAATSMLANRGALGQQPPQARREQPPAPARAKAPGGGSALGGGHPDPFPPLERHSTVALVRGEDRRKMVYESLKAIDDELQPRMKNKKYAVIKPNNVSTTNQLAATHVDALRGILDYFEERFRKPVIIAESSAGDTLQGFENFKYNSLPGEYKKLKVSLVDLNRETKYVLKPIIDYNLHLAPVRLAARLFDPEAFVLCSAVMKTHNMAIVTLSVKNMVLGAPLHFAPEEKIRWNDKRRYHVGIRQSIYNMYLTAQYMQPYWGAAIIDGYEGMEGNGPASGTPVPHRIVLASTDYIALDRVGAECMGVDANWLGWLRFCGEAGVGQWDLARIDIRGPKPAEVQRKYRLHADIERQLKWMGPMEELPVNLGWVTPFREHDSEAYG